MKSVKIVEKLTWIMVNKLKVNPILIVSENFNKPLTGTLFELKKLDLLYLFFEIEKNFSIIFTTTKILDYEFNTINGIIHLIDEEIAE